MNFSLRGRIVVLRAAAYETDTNGGTFLTPESRALSDMQVISTKENATTHQHAASIPGAADGGGLAGLAGLPEGLQSSLYEQTNPYHKGSVESPQPYFNAEARTGGADSDILPVALRTS